MHCVEAQAEMTAYLAEELDPEVRALLDVHLAGCASCRAELEAFRGTWAALGALPTPMPGPDLEAQLLARLRGEAVPVRGRPLLRPLRIPIAALIAALLSVGLSRLLPYETAARLCQEALGALFPPGGLSATAGAFVVGILYAAFPVLFLALLAARLDARRPLVEGGCTAGLFVLILSPYVMAVCAAFPVAFVVALLAGLTTGAFSGGLGGFWLGWRVARPPAPA